MRTPSASRTALSRRTLLAAGAAVLSGAGGLTAARQARADGTLIWNAWGPLAGYGVSAECNPGGGGFACGAADVSITVGSDTADRFSNVNANPRGIVTYVNAIGNRRFIDVTPDGAPLALAGYQYLYAVRLPRVPTKDSAPWIPEQTHQMIQFWDGSNRLWPANKHTLEAASFWKLNPWRDDYGRVFVYTTDANGALARHDTGITVPPDVNWHVFDIRVDLEKRVYAGISVDGKWWNPLTNVPLARIHHQDWGSELALILTAESENAYPSSPDTVTRWTTQFKDPKLYRLP